MEVEVKLRIPDSDSHQRLASLLSPFHLQTHLQENVFFDGGSGKLSSSRSVLRLRFYNADSRCVVSLKGKAVIVDGISRVEVVEEDFDASLGRACVAEPWRLAAVDSGLVKRVVCLGGFRNVRAVHEWQGLIWEILIMDADSCAARFAASNRQQSGLQICSGADLQSTFDDFDGE